MNPKSSIKEKKHDWDALYKEFLESGMTKRKFLMSKGVHPTHPNARAWGTSVWKAREAVKEAMQEREADAPKQIADLLGLVQTWSLGLAPKHYQAANLLRTHAELFLEKSLVIENGEIAGTKLKPREMNALAQVLSQCQKMERLALGLSTENVAANHMAPQDGAHVEKPVERTEAEQRGPVFVVEVNQNGKFVRPRPRMLLQSVVTEDEDKKRA